MTPINSFLESWIGILANLIGIGAFLASTIVLLIRLISSPKFRAASLRIVRSTPFYLAIVSIVSLSIGLYIPRRNSILQDVKNRGYLKCGIDGNTKGFSYVNGKSDGSNYLVWYWPFSSSIEYWYNADGFEPDLCRAVAAGIFGIEYNNKRVRFYQVTTAQRFDTIENDIIDVLIRDTTRTVGRSAKYNIANGPIYFYDWQSFLVSDPNIHSANDLRGHKVCVTVNTTTEAFFDEYAPTYDMKPVKDRNGKAIETNDDLLDAFARNQCDAITADKSQLSSIAQDSNGKYRVLDDIIQREPLAPVYKYGDREWANVVDYCIYATIYAYQLGISNENLSKSLESLNPNIVQFLGTSADEDSLGKALGLSKEFTQYIINRVGNYDDLYKKHLDQIIHDRGSNDIRDNDHNGILYSPPFVKERIIGKQDG